MSSNSHFGSLLVAAVLGLLLVSSGLVLPSSATSVNSKSVVKVSPNHSPWANGCNGQTEDDSYNSKVEPYVAVNPKNPNNIIGVYQQDRYPDGGANGIVTAYSMDGGKTWNETWAPFTFCSGGTTANGGAYQRASDPWITFAPNGVAYQSALAFNGTEFDLGASAVVVSMSTDGGKTWSNATTIILKQGLLSDKDSITADPTNSKYIYVVWDLDGTGAQIYFSRTTDGGKTWSTATEINSAPTVNNMIVVTPKDVLIDYFTDDNTGDLAYITSSNHGSTWSGISVVSTQQDIGVYDPRTGQLVRTGAGLAQVTIDPRNGNLYAVWEDARFSNDETEAIAFSESTNGGSTWSSPIQVNQSPSGVQAFTPSVTVNSKGVVGVTYYDFRYYKSGDSGVPTDLWIVTCSSACTKSSSWTEQHVAGSFNIENAPDTDSGCCFLGDYSTMTTIGHHFEPFFIMAVNNVKIYTDAYSSVLS